MTIIIESRFLVYHSSSVGYNNRVNAFEHLIEILITISGAYYFLLECTKEEIRAIPNKYTTILDFQSATGDIFSVNPQGGGRKMFDPSLALRFIVIGLTVGIMASIIVSTIIITQKTQELPPVYESNIHLVLDRSIAVYELDLFYDPRATLEDFIESLNFEYKSYFSLTCLKLIVTAFKLKPIALEKLPSPIEQISKDTPSNVVLNVTVFFNQSYTAEEVRAALINYIRIIYLINKYNGKPSGRFATINLEKSIFTATILSSFKKKDALMQKDVEINMSPQDYVLETIQGSSNSFPTSPPVQEKTCDSFVPAYMSITFERSFPTTEKRQFADLASTLQDLATNVQNRIKSKFGSSFIKLDILLFSDQPILFSNTQTVLTTVVCRIYLTSNQRAILIEQSFKDDTQSIALLDVTNVPSSALATVTRTPEITVSTITTTARKSSTHVSEILTTTSRCHLNDQVYEAYMSISLLLSATNDEMAVYSNIGTTIEAIRVSLNVELKVAFPLSFLKFNYIMMSNQPIVFSTTKSRRRKRQPDQTAVIIVIGKAYFTKSQSRFELRTSLKNYKLGIDVLNKYGTSNTRLSSFSADHSIFGDTSSIELTSEEIVDLTAYC
ncbi:hypothetical protein I4U23_019853 [Adineta vaga]|nr:hypothetical protein I4U23_019853 [Adineta vaga]